MACEACMTLRGKQKVVKKFTWLRANLLGECIFIETIKPFTLGCESQKYWVQVVWLTRHG